MRIGEGEYKLPDYIPTRGHLLLQGKKISKSRHWSISIRSFLALFPPDYLRYYLTRIVPYDQSDADFSWTEFRDKINNELVANVGNFVYRSLVFVKNNHDGVVPKPGPAGDEEKAVLSELEAAVQDTGSLIEAGNYDRALKRVLEFSGRCNQYFQRKAPWDDKTGEATTVYYACNFVASIATLLYPFLPFASEAIWDQLGFTSRVEDGGWGDAAELRVEEGRALNEPRPPFKKVEEPDLTAAEKLLG